EGSVCHGDKIYNDHNCEDMLREAAGVILSPVRKKIPSGQPTRESDGPPGRTPGNASEQPSPGSQIFSRKKFTR
ncbi:MAG: hypothetical protein B6245_14870, partial [Desulfobacteraceae bacterium 4572_88]